jgi:stress response protein SCP2
MFKGKSKKGKKDEKSSSKKDDSKKKSSSSSAAPKLDVDKAKKSPASSRSKKSSSSKAGPSSSSSKKKDGSSTPRTRTKSPRGARDDEGSRKPRLADVGGRARSQSKSRLYLADFENTMGDASGGTPAKKVTAVSADAVAKTMPRVGYEDMTQMDDMTLEGVLANVDLRYKSDLIYTYTGSILVAINPFKRLPIYTPAFVKRYVGNRIGLLPPHIYAIAEGAFTAMYEAKANQSILISGESGAGKTETTKLVLGFLSGRTDNSKKTTTDIEAKILESVPILEAFGNARTLRNDNSSRFGKYIEIQFDNTFAICGSKIIPYLLEKSRLVSQLKGERNYHIFYQLTEGSEDEDREKYHFRPANWYNYLTKSGCFKLDDPDYDEGEELKDLKRALRLFDISSKVLDHMWRVLSAVLHCGNIMWEGDPKARLANDEAHSALDIVGEMLGLEKNYLRYALSHKRITVAGDDIWKDLSGPEARDLTDAFAKSLYAKLFDWLVEKLNEQTRSEVGKTFIGVLDIFGFENFGQNEMEQFLINLANEKLQQFFNTYIFKLEQAEYRREKIDFSTIEFVDNQDVLDLIEASRPPGILAVLAEQCRFQRATSRTLIDALNDNFADGKSPHYEKERLKRSHFTLEHYAGKVTYDVAGWLERNRDELAPHLIELMVDQAQNPFVSLLYTDTDQDAVEHGSKRVRTLGAQFKGDLQSLMDALSVTQPWFCRCIKPNMVKKPDTFNAEEIEEQLRYAGMLETIRIRRLGYPVRYVHRDFLYRYQVLDPSYKRVKGDDKTSCDNLVKTLKIKPERVRLGITKVFLKQELANELDDGRNEALMNHIIKLQTWWRMVYARMRFNDMKAASVVIQASVRGWIARRRFLAMRRSAVSIQCAYRQRLARAALAHRREEHAKYLRALSERERKARDKAEREKEARDKEAIEALRRGELPDYARRAAEAKAAEEARKRRKKKKRRRLEQGETLQLEQNVEIEIPDVILKSKISIAVGWHSESSKLMLTTTCLMYRYDQFRDAVHDLNDLSRDGSVEHLGYPYWQRKKNAAGDDEEPVDKEHMSVNLSRVSPKTTTLIFVVNLFSRRLDWSDIGSSYVRILDRASEQELGRFNIAVDEPTATAMVMCKLARSGISNWKLTPIGEAREARNYKLLLPTLSDFLDVPPPLRGFDVTIHAAKDVPKPRRGTPDAYGALLFDTEKVKTAVVKKSFAPKFRARTNRIVGRALALEVRIYARNRWSSSDAVLANKLMPLDGNRISLSKKWIELEPSGKIQISVQEIDVVDTYTGPTATYDDDDDDGGGGGGGNASAASSSSSSSATPRSPRGDKAAAAPKSPRGEKSSTPKSPRVSSKKSSSSSSKKDSSSSKKDSSSSKKDASSSSKKKGKSKSKSSKK